VSSLLSLLFASCFPLRFVRLGQNFFCLVPHRPFPSSPPPFFSPRSPKVLCFVGYLYLWFFDVVHIPNQRLSSRLVTPRCGNWVHTFLMILPTGALVPPAPPPGSHEAGTHSRFFHYGSMSRFLQTTLNKLQKRHCRSLLRCHFCRTASPSYFFWQVRIMQTLARTFIIPDTFPIFSGLPPLLTFPHPPGFVKAMFTRGFSFQGLSFPVPWPPFFSFATTPCLCP